MSCMSEVIEQYLLALLRRGAIVELQRAELAQRFRCAPSQINYVLSTRFTPARGFSVESRRGGGGYIRVSRLPEQARTDLAVGDEMDQLTAEHHIDRLQGAGRLTLREAAVLRAVVSRDVLILPLPLRDRIRAAVLQAGLRAILQEELRESRFAVEARRSGRQGGEAVDVPAVPQAPGALSRQQDGQR